MPVYKQFKYYKIRDCPTCRFFKFNSCHHLCPNEFNCSFITNKVFQNKYFFKTSILGRTFIRRGFKTKQAAREAESKFREQLIDDNYLRSIRVISNYKEMILKYGDYLKDNFKSTYTTDIKRKIQNFYSLLLPDVPITKLVKSDADKLRAKIDKEKITYKSKNKHLNFMFRFFLWIEKFYHYKYNEIFLLEHFRDYEIRRQKKKTKVVEFDDFIKIYKSCDDDYYKLGLLTMFIFGYRLGEQLALTVDSISFEDNTIEIYQSVNFKGGKGKGKFTLTTPKTPSGERIQNMPGIYSTLIKKHIEENKLKDSDFIFFRDSEHKKIPIHENTFRRKCEAYCRSFNPDFHPHMLRTSIVTHLREKGVPLTEVSKYIGHADPKITEEYYSKKSLTKQNMINEVIDEILKKIT